MSNLTLKNVTHRNVGLIGTRKAKGGVAHSLTVPALSTMIFTEEEMSGLEVKADKLIAAGVLVLVEESAKPKATIAKKKAEATKKEV